VKICLGEVTFSVQVLFFSDGEGLGPAANKTLKNYNIDWWKGHIRRKRERSRG